MPPGGAFWKLNTDKDLGILQIKTYNGKNYR